MKKKLIAMGLVVVLAISGTQMAGATTLSKAKNQKNQAQSNLNSVNSQAGTGRLCTCLMSAFGDRLFGKSGAASFYGIGLKDRGIGIAVKLEDGCSEFMPGVVMKVLTDLGVISQQEQEKLGACWEPNIYNHHNQVVGRKEIDFSLLPDMCEQECV